MPAPRHLRRQGLAAASRRPSLLLTATLLCGLAAACAPRAHAATHARDPLAVLPAAVPSQVFDLAFWVHQETGRTLLWRHAFTYCRFHAVLPNCRTVRLASWWGSPLASIEAPHDTPAAEALAAPSSATVVEQPHPAPPRPPASADTRPHATTPPAAGPQPHRSRQGEHP